MLNLQVGRSVDQ